MFVVVFILFPQCCLFLCVFFMSRVLNGNGLTNNLLLVSGGWYVLRVVALRMIRWISFPMADAKRMSLNHVFSCEYDKPKQNFIQKNFGPAALFSDITRLVTFDKKAFDVISQDRRDFVRVCV